MIEPWSWKHTKTRKSLVACIRTQIFCFIYILLEIGKNSLLLSKKKISWNSFEYFYIYFLPFLFFVAAYGIVHRSYFILHTSVCKSVNMNVWFCSDDCVTMSVIWIFEQSTSNNRCELKLNLCEIYSLNVWCIFIFNIS